MEILRAFEHQITESTLRGVELDPIIKPNLIVKTTTINSKPKAPVKFLIQSGNDKSDDFGEGSLKQIEGESEVTEEDTRSSVSLPPTLFDSNGKDKIER